MFLSYFLRCEAGMRRVEDFRCGLVGRGPPWFGGVAEGGWIMMRFDTIRLRHRREGQTRRGWLALKEGWYRYKKS